MASSSKLQLFDAFRARHSVRHFESGLFPSDKQEFVEKAIKLANSIPVPFNNKCEIKHHPPGLGAGSITGEAGWIITLIPNDSPQSDEVNTDVSFRLQYATMMLSEEGIGTVWVTGTFSPHIAEKANPGYRVLGGVAYGLVPKTKFLEKTNKCNENRKSISSLFYNADKNEAFNEKNMGNLENIIMALRSGPSAMNRQPWAFVFQGNMIHLFNTYGRVKCDMGIALANIYLVAKNNGVEPNFQVLSPAPKAYLNGTYVCSCNFKGNTEL